MISVVTPAFNRSHTLKRLYESLLGQTCSDFEWVIIDDGSSDETKDLIFGFINEDKIKISYFYQENSGKHVALNSATQKSSFNWIFIVDSDDKLTFDAIDKIRELIIKYDADDILGLSFRRSYFDGVLIGERVEEVGERFLKPNEAGKIYKGDLAYIFRRDALSKCCFPVIKNEKFVPELYIWNQISDMGKIVYSNNVSIYFTEYLDDGYTKGFKKCFKNNPVGFFIFYSDQFKREKRVIFKIKYLIRSIQCFINISKFQL